MRPATLLKKSLWHKYFPVNFAKFLRRPFLQNTSGQLLRSSHFRFSLPHAFWTTILFVCLFVFCFFCKNLTYSQKIIRIHSKTAYTKRNYHITFQPCLFLLLLLIFPIFKILRIANLWGKFLTIVTFITKGDGTTRSKSSSRFDVIVWK